jgi:hypothetical protein
MVHFIDFIYKIGSLSRTRFNGTLEWIRKPVRHRIDAFHREYTKLRIEKAYETEPVVNSVFGVIGCPFSSISLPISKADNMLAILKNNDDIARCRPGHIL